VKRSAIALLLVLPACAPAPAPPTPAPPPPAAQGPPPSTPPTPPPVPAPVEAGEPAISVGLAWDLDSLTLDPVGRADVQASGRRVLESAARLEVRVARSRAVVRAIGGDAPWEMTLAPDETLRVSGTDGTADSPTRLVRWKGSSWRGELRAFVNPRGRLTLAARLPIEAYLRGVVPGEIGALESSLLEAGRAQAIAARSYTLFYRGRRAAEGFDLYSTVEDQVYGPVEHERPLATRCVESTAGEVALSGGAPIRANYYSTCGGITADVWEGWATPPLPYLVSHRDRGPDGRDWCFSSPHHRWREEWSAAEFASNLARFGPQFGVVLPPGGPGRIVDVRVASRSRSGRVWRLDIRTTTGDVVVPAYALRQVLRRGGNAAAILRSTLFKIDVLRDPATREAQTVVASGGGSGHGVGLCQTGALGMARAGVRGESILEHYYPGAVIERRW
jgi:stage II sporulation protein D